MIDEAEQERGRIDGVINAAGVAAFGPVAEIDDDTVDDLVLVDFLGPLRLLRAALPVVEQGGVIIGISAVLAEQPVAGMATYSAVKAAASTLYVAAAKEARRSKIRVVDVRPPHTETGLVGRAIAGDAPKMPDGLDPNVVADRVVAAISGASARSRAPTSMKVCGMPASGIHRGQHLVDRRVLARRHPPVAIALHQHVHRHLRESTVDRPAGDLSDHYIGGRSDDLR